MASRYRSYTSYSEENGKLVPAIEPQEKDVKMKVVEEKSKLVTIIVNAAKQDDEKEKLKSPVTNEKLPRLP